MTIQLFDLNKTDRYDITEILLTLALNTITLTLTRLSNTQAHGAWISFPPPPFSLLPPLFSKFSYKSFLFQNFHNHLFFLHLTISVDVIHHE